MSDNKEFSVESTPVLTRADSLSFDTEKTSLDVFATEESGGSDFFGASSFDVDNEKTEVLTDLDNEHELTAYLVDLEGNKVALNKFPFQIGRDKQAGLTLKSPGISRTHAEIVFESGRFVINDLGSVNGIRVNGYKVSRVILETDDLVKIGDVALKFQIGEGSTAVVAEPAPQGAGANVTPNVSAAPNPAATAPSFEMDFSALAKPAIMLVCGIVLILAAVFMFKSISDTDRVMVVDAAPPAQPRAEQKAVAPAKSSSEKAVAQPAVSAKSSQPETGPEPVGNKSIADASAAPASPTATVSPVAVVQRPISKPAATLNTSQPSGLPQSAIVNKPKVAKAKKAVPKSSPENDRAKALLAKSQAQYMADRAEQYVRDLNILAANQKVSSSVRAQMTRKASQFNQILAQHDLAKQNLAQGRREEAATAYAQFIQLEDRAKFSAKSSKRREAENWLALHFFNKAEEAQARGEHLEAYDYWQRSVRLGSSTGAKVALANVEARAKRLYRKALRLEYVNSTQAKANWLEVTQIVPRNNEYHIKSKKKLAWYDAWAD